VALAKDDLRLRLTGAWATGAGDQAAAACGCGLVDPGSMLVTIGSGGGSSCTRVTSAFRQVPKASCSR
jgi:sugar (pentulose or hexulose) kinase